MPQGSVRLLRWPVLLMAALLLLAACDRNEQESAQAAAAAQPPPPVTVANPLVQRMVEWDEFTGRFEATASVEIRARVSGYLDQIYFQDGGLVEKDQILFLIDPRPFTLAVERARANVESAQARLNLARLELERASRLVESSAMARATLDQRLQENQQAGADLAAAQAALRQAELDLQFTQVRAPIAGRISNRRVDVGNLVNDQTVLTTIVTLDPIYFVFDMSEADFLAYQRAIARGELMAQRGGSTVVRVQLPDETGWDRIGRLDFVDNVVSASSGTVRARALFDNPDQLITPGQFGRLRLPGSPEYDALLVPDSAIGTDQSRQFVLTVKDDGTVEPRIVRPGPRENGLRIIRRGLAPTDRVVIDGLIRARPGAKVTPQPGRIEFATAAAS